MLLLAYYCYFWHTNATLQTSKGRVSDCLVLARQTACRRHSSCTLSHSHRQRRRKRERKEEGGENYEKKVQRNERGVGGQMDKLAKLPSLKALTKPKGTHKATLQCAIFIGPMYTWCPIYGFGWQYLQDLLLT